MFKKADNVQRKSLESWRSVAQNHFKILHDSLTHWKENIMKWVARDICAVLLKFGLNGFSSQKNPVIVFILTYKHGHPIGNFNICSFQL